MHTSATLILRRVDRLVHERLQPAVIADRRPLQLAAWEAPGEPVPFTHAVAQAYQPASAGMAWGAPWSTTWLRARGQTPADWPTDNRHRIELAVDLGFTGSGPGFQAEGLVYRADGTILEAISPRNQRVRLDDPRVGVDVYIEAAGNPDVSNFDDFQPTSLGVPEAREQGPLYRLTQVDLVLRDLQVAELLADVTALLELARELDEHSTRRAQILRALDQAVDLVDPEDVPGTAAAARDRLAPVLAVRAAEGTHEVVAAGHAHIDSAWLWPTRETIRKCARTFANVLALMEEDPDFVFVCSSAQQYAWIAEHYPELFARIKARVTEGRWVPVGSMWVESDTNMPGGEAFVRQLVAGKRFFLEHFGVETRDVWLPDSFGYSGALPQLARLAGAQWFLSQKLSWNESDRMPHHTFWWEGIDGSRVLTHFPPVDTYNSELSAAELRHAERNFADKAVASSSIVPFGYGDGGGGPSREMVARARRYSDLDGVPRVRMESPVALFAETQAEVPADLGTWTGEMYLEFHRGTYTSQARTKRGNRRSEHLLREAELWAATAAVRTGADYPYDVLERSWHTVLLNQFHDILPGSSIGWVYRDAEASYAQVSDDLESVIEEASAAVAGSGDQEMLLNAGPLPMSGVPAGAGAVPTAPEGAPVQLVREAGGAVMDNGLLRVRIDERGLVTSLVHLPSGREAIAAGLTGNLLTVHRDVPRQWDAWDTDVEHRRVGTDLTSADTVEVIAEGPDEVSMRVRRSFGASTVVQLLTVRRGDPVLQIETEVDWHERQKLLKLGFPFAVHADSSAAETQFGYVRRPTHTNTSWDAAKFEICAHRWVHVGEPGFGVAVANDATYGHDVTRVRSAMPAPADTVPGPLPVAAEAPATIVRQSLLKAPLYPDPEADQGQHTFTTLVHAGAGIAEAVAAGYRANLPARTVAGAGPVQPLLRVDGEGVLVESVKLAGDRSGDVVVRLYEALGGHHEARVQADFEHRDVLVTDLLERELEPAEAVPGDGAGAAGGAGSGTGSPGAGAASDSAGIEVRLRPFEVRTLRFRR